MNGRNTQATLTPFLCHGNVNIVTAVSHSTYA